MFDPLASLFHGDPSIEFINFGDVEIVNSFGQPALEYAAICKGCGLMAMPQRGFIEMTGPDRLEFLGNLITNRTFDRATKSGIAPGSVVSSLLLNLKGRIVCEMNVIELGERLLVETQVRQIPLLMTFFDRYLFSEKVRIADRSDSLYEFALMGDGSESVLRELLQIESPPGRMMNLTLTSPDRMTIFRDDLTGSPCYLVVVDRVKATELWRRFVERFSVEQERQPARRRLRPVGWAAFNSARIEAGRAIPLIDYELAEPSLPGKASDHHANEAKPHSLELLPAELNDVERVLDFNKGCYLGQEIVARMHARRQVARKIAGWKAQDDALPLAGAPVLNDREEQIGIVTSSTLSPRLGNVAIGLALVKKPYFEIDSQVNIPAEGSTRAVKIVPMPFV